MFEMGKKHPPNKPCYHKILFLLRMSILLVFSKGHCSLIKNSTPQSVVKKEYCFQGFTTPVFRDVFGVCSIF